MPRLSILLPLDVETSVTVDQAREIEASGLAGVWVPDHLTGGSFFQSGVWHGSLATLTAIAGATKALRLGTLVASAVMRPAAVLGLELQTVSQPGREIVAGVGTGTDKDAVITGIVRPTPEGLRDYCLKVREYVPHVVVAGNLSSTVRVAAEIGASWVTTGGLKKTGDEKLRMFERLHRAWIQAGGSGEVFVVLDPHEPSPWAGENAMQQLLRQWGDLGAGELVVWPPERYSQSASINYAAAAAIASPVSHA